MTTITTTEKAITAAATKWPVAGGKSFAGTFDGQKHTISGIYQAVNGDKVGIFVTFVSVAENFNNKFWAMFFVNKNQFEDVDFAYGETASLRHFYCHFIHFYFFLQSNQLSF